MEMDRGKEETKITGFVKVCVQAGGQFYSAISSITAFVSQILVIFQCLLRVSLAEGIN